METCSVCGTEFKPRQGGKTQRYCSRQCYSASKAGRRKLSPRLGIEKACETCGKTYSPFYADQRFCGSKCKGLAQRIVRQAICETCGKEFLRGSKPRRFCSRQCHYDSAIGNKTNAGGYLRVLVPRGTPGADGNGRMLEHRYVMQQAIGRPIEPGETVHHLNGDKTDNRLENLQLRVGRHGKGQVLRCRCCGSTDFEAVEIGVEA